MSSDPIVIVGMARTPIGGFQGKLLPRSAPELGAAAIEAALDRAGIVKKQVDGTIMGCVLPAGLGQAPARQASLGAGLGEDVPCTTINKCAAQACRQPSWLMMRSRPAVMTL